MKTTILILVFLLTSVCSTYSQKKSYADGKALKFLTGLMFYEKESNTEKLTSGFFLGTEFELPMSPSSIRNSFVPYFVPELNYWQVENTKAISGGINFRGKFKAGSTRPYIDFGVTFTRLTRGNVDNTRGGVNAGAGIDIILSNSNISVVIDMKVRAQIYESRLKAGVSLTPGIRIGF